MSELRIKEIKSSIPKIFGHVQCSVISDILRTGSTARLNAYMKTGRYSTNYQASIKGAMRWLKTQGIDWKYVTGIRGGDWSAKYIMF